jgi:hypothetical protein
MLRAVLVATFAIGNLAPLLADGNAKPMAPHHGGLSSRMPTTMPSSWSSTAHRSSSMYANTTSHWILQG